MSLKTLHDILGFFFEVSFCCLRVSLIGLHVGINAQRELNGPACSAWTAPKEISETNCDFQTKGTPPNVTRHPHLNFTAIAFPLDSCLNVPEKSASVHTFRSNVPSCFTMSPLSAMSTRQQMMHLTALACDSPGHAVCQAACLAANVMSGLMLFDTHNNIPTMLAQSQCF